MVINKLSSRVRAALAVMRRVRCERSAGAPWVMVRVYARIEWEHALAGHGGDAGRCNPCHGMPERGVSADPQGR